jgi:hypothetical protein
MALETFMLGQGQDSPRQSTTTAGAVVAGAAAPATGSTGAGRWRVTP